MKTFSNYCKEIDEGFLDSLKQGFYQNYSQAKATPENSNDLEKYAQQAIPAIQKAKGTADEWAKKLGISLPLATVLVASGIIGGATAIPFAALMYFVRKPLNQYSGAAFDKMAQMTGVMPQQAPQQAPQQNWRTDALGNFADHNLSFNTYLNNKQLNEGWFGDKVKQAKQWWNDKGADQVGGALGKAAGFVAGKTSKYATNVSNLIKNSSSALLQFSRENKLPIAKAAFMMSVGALVGAGIGAITKPAIADIMNGLQGSSSVPQSDMEWLEKNFKLDVEKDSDGIYHLYNSQIYTSDGEKPWSNPNIPDNPNPGSDYTWTNPDPGDPKYQTPDQYVSTSTVNNVATTLADELKNSSFSDTLSNITVTQFTDPSVGPDEMGLTLHAQILPKPGENIQDLVKKAYEDLSQHIKEKGYEIQHFQPVKAWQEINPNEPIQIQALIKAGAIGGAIGVSQKNNN